ncbi:MAG: hypothetical protein ABSA64_04950 [Sedimentisphaerales bacterium]
MDLRELIRQSPDIVFGHIAVNESLNVKNEIRRLSNDPLQEYLTMLDDDQAVFFQGDIGRYKQAFSWYILSLRRVLEHCSLARRFDKELRWHPVTVKYSTRQSQIARTRKSMSSYQELDYQNLIIYACLLLDRTISLSRRFLRGKNLPSFTSFNQHKAFLRNHGKELNKDFHAYVDYIILNTEWFDIPLKILRDKYLMHSSEKHMSYFGWSTQEQWDLEMVKVISALQGQDKLLERVKVIRFSPRRLARDIEIFLHWFSQYAQINTALI